MKKFKLGLLFLALVLILATMGCGSQPAKSPETQSTSQETAPSNQSSTSTPTAANDSTQTQSSTSTPKTSNDPPQTQTNVSKSTQPAVTNDAQSKSIADAAATAQATVQTQDKEASPTEKSNPLVTITMSSGEQIKVELYPDVAPNTVKSFISLVQKGFYNGLSFHRVIPGFMIQGGDPNGNGTGGPGYSIKGEFTNNGFINNLKHERGVISMGRTQYNLNSAGSQFFIMAATVPSLDKDYAAFGKVISGMETVDKVVNSSRDKADKPLDNQVMKSVTVETFGVKYAEPEVLRQ